MGSGFFLLDRTQHVSRPGDVGKVDLSLDLFVGASAGRSGRSGRFFCVSAEMLADKYCLVLL
jgi:hypothetical protein